MNRTPLPGAHGFYAARRVPMARAQALLAAAFAAGTLSTVVQAMLWAVSGDDWLALLYRDARLAAALLLGRSVLPPPASFDVAVMASATAVHGGLSLAYAALLAPLAERGSTARAGAAGAVFGLALYAVNLHGLTELFPWFVAARGWITVVAHVVFGVAGALTWRWARGRRDA